MYIYIYSYGGHKQELGSDLEYITRLCWVFFNLQSGVRGVVPHATLLLSLFPHYPLLMLKQFLFQHRVFLLLPLVLLLPQLLLLLLLLLLQHQLLLSYGGGALLLLL